VRLIALPPCARRRVSASICTSTIEHIPLLPTLPLHSQHSLSPTANYPHTAVSHLLCTHLHHISSIPQFSPFFSLLHTLTTTIYRLYLSSIVGFLLFCRGLVQSNSAPLEFGGAHHLFNKIPYQHSKMPKSLVSASQASGSRAQSSRPTCEQRELLFKTTFDIDGDFKNFEATQ
jgi:hypothetical protein